MFTKKKVSSIQSIENIYVKYLIKSNNGKIYSRL